MISMYYELSKSEKKIARQLIDKGLDTAYTKAMQSIEAIVNQWQQQKLNNKDAYLTLYKELDKHDNAIAARYNGLGGSRYLMTVALLFSEKIITEEDIQGFHEKTKEVIHFLGSEED